MNGCLVQSITAGGKVGPVMLCNVRRTFFGNPLSLRLEDLYRTGSVGACTAGKSSTILIPKEFI